MEIKASCKFDFASVLALYHLSLFKKHNPRTMMMLYTVPLCALIPVIICTIILNPPPTLPSALYVAFAMLLFLCFMYFLAPRIQYRRMAKVRMVENGYIFGDDALKVFSKSDEYNGEATVAYAFFASVYETSKYLFLFQTSRQAFIVDKSTIEGGTAEEIRARLTACVGKYILCKY